MQPPNHLPFSPKADLSLYLYLYLSIFFSFQPLPSVMDAAAHWPQGIGVECSRNVEKKPRPAQEQALNCPRCKSTNTKFCYYNNYSLSQPRYFCKSCRRYWTEGGTLRNVPVGGSSRKNKRSSNTNSTKKLMIPEPDLISPPRLISPQQNPKMSYNDPVTPYNGISELVALPFALEAENLNPQNPNSSSSSSSMRGIFSSSGGQLITSPLISLPAVSYDPNSAFKLDGVQNRFGNMVQGDDPSNSSRMTFPFEDQSRPLVNDHSNGYWSGMLSGGSW